MTTHGSSRAVERATRLSAWIVAASACGLLAASCRDLVAGDVVDAEDALCTRLEACGLDGCGRVESFFVEGSAPGIDALLATFAEHDCGRGCADAPLCLDVPGLCIPSGNGCSSDVLCCGASGGEARCQDVPPGAVDEEGELLDEALCCLGLGVECTPDDDACCFLDSGERMRCLPAPGDVRGAFTCGGAPRCASLEEACTSGEQCCSGSCVDERCEPVRCVPSGAACGPTDTCCSSSDACVDGTCQPPQGCPGASDCPCGGPGATCTPGAEGTCCGDLFCLVTADGSAVCAGPDCTPLDGDCATDEDCRCPGSPPGVACIEVQSTGVGAQKTCQPLGCEPLEGGACGPGRPCCASSGLTCDAAPGETGTCAPECQPTSCARDPHTFGAPITRSEDLDDASDPACVRNAQCASAVCASDPYCCCFLWDEICVAQAADVAAGSTDGLCQPAPSSGGGAP